MFDRNFTPNYAAFVSYGLCDRGMGCFQAYSARGPINRRLHGSQRLQELMLGIMCAGHLYVIGEELFRPRFPLDYLQKSKPSGKGHLDSGCKARPKCPSLFDEGVSRCSEFIWLVAKRFAYMGGGSGVLNTAQGLACLISPPRTIQPRA